MKQIYNITLALIIFIILSPTVSGNNIDTVFSDANSAYKNRAFEEAINLYQSIVDSGYESAELYYNIGNAFFKTGQFPRAILNYERALNLEPNDEDIKFNLAKSQTYVVDKIEAIPEFFIKTWFSNLIIKLPSNTWAGLALLAFLLSVSGFLVFFLTRKTLLKRSVFTVSVLLVTGFVVLGFFSLRSKAYVENSNTAIVMTPTVTVKSSPDNDGLDVFIIHEGSKVSILRNLAGWYEIRIADGKQGWLKEEDVEKI